MTETAVDRNEAFKAERLAQIDAIYNQRANQIEAAERLRAETERRVEAGELIPVGNDRYRVTGSTWDNGEYWTLQTPKGLDQPLLLPQDGLDKTTGEVALYTRVPAWHELGTVVPAGLSDVDAVLRAGGIDFEVLQRPAMYNRPVPLLPDANGERKGGLKSIPGTFVNVRNDTGAALGVVGKIYTPIQNREGAVFLQTLVDDYGVVFESAGATYDGAHVFIGLRLPEDVILDLGDGVQDTIRPYLFWRNTHDGTASLSVIVTPWRIECGNTERFALRDAVSEWKVRHTTNALKQVEEARRTLGLSLNYFDALKDEEEKLARVTYQIKDFEALIDEVFKLKDDASDLQQRRADERKGVLTSMQRAEADKLGWTAYAAERTITDYLDHAAPKRLAGTTLAAAQATAIVEGGVPDKIKSRAHQVLVQQTGINKR